MSSGDGKSTTSCSGFLPWVKQVEANISQIKKTVLIQSKFRIEFKLSSKLFIWLLHSLFLEEFSARLSRKVKESISMSAGDANPSADDDHWLD
ncbi:hypothetical protein Nepgr_027394 [Nepenthes gracilis]|uniref:Uncharacterized protein n=1 Tax=Nepenthes gracilis TaxID=150966 RepID=A0AAD3TBA3_NEPGR|nr:hypothetical protein Nepgr_027394 [Nepenthes gracilis]